jgi:hypothetical protein
MPPKKGVSAEDKRERLLNLIRSSNTCWLIKVRVRYPRYQCAHRVCVAVGVPTVQGPARVWGTHHHGGRHRTWRRQAPSSA